MDRIPERQGAVPTGDGAQIVYRCFGGGDRALVLLHGNGEDYTCFDRQLDDFAESFRVIAIDSRGHGDSTAGELGLSIGAMAGDTAAVLDALGVERASLVGFSDGANVAMAFALRYPERVVRLVLAGGNLDPRGVNPAAQNPIVLGYWAAKACGFFSHRARDKAAVLGLMVNGPHMKPADLAEIHAPVLVLAGDDDLILDGHTELIAASLPDARLVTVPESDHFIFQKQPEFVNRTILRFLAGT